MFSKKQNSAEPNTVCRASSEVGEGVAFEQSVFEKRPHAKVRNQTAKKQKLQNLSTMLPSCHLAVSRWKLLGFHQALHTTLAI